MELNVVDEVRGEKMNAETSHQNNIQNLHTNTHVSHNENNTLVGTVLSWSILLFKLGE